MIGPSEFDSFWEQKPAPKETPPSLPSGLQEINSFSDLPDDVLSRLHVYTEMVSDMVMARFKEKASPDVKGKDLYLACLVEQIAYLLMTQQSQNMILMQLSEKLKMVEGTLKRIREGS